mmetsp:Transcript_39521/g.117551  ORF Transcript_39521/g.117551 Transcript_39521/m.117551 type:complete len:236 (+) Transcript_39521:607-1314(+)
MLQVRWSLSHVAWLTPLSKRRKTLPAVLCVQQLRIVRLLQPHACCEVDIGALVDCFLGHAKRQRGASADGLGQLQRLFKRRALGHGMLCKPQAQRFSSVHAPTRKDELLGTRLPDGARQALCAARAGDDPQLRLWERKHRARPDDAHVARQCQLSTAAERRAVDDSERWDGHCLQLAKRAAKRADKLRHLVLSHACTLLEVRARTKDARHRAAQHDAARGPLLPQRVDGLCELRQ